MGDWRPDLRNKEAQGPLSPDPFSDTEWVEPDVWPAYFLQYPWADREFPPSLYSEEIRLTVSSVAYIPKGALPAMLRVFRDDRVARQPEWYSAACIRNCFRATHGLDLHHHINPTVGLLPIPPNVRVICGANPTKLRGWFQKFDAPVEQKLAAAPATMPPAGSKLNRQVLGISSVFRATNGFLSTPAGRLGSTLMKLRLYLARDANASKATPAIGSLLHTWIAADGCRLVCLYPQFFSGVRRVYRRSSGRLGRSRIPKFRRI